MPGQRKYRHLAGIDLTLAGLFHIPYHRLLLLGGTVLTFLVAFTITAFGLVLAVRVQSVQTVMPVMQLLLTRLMFLSGSLFPSAATSRPGCRLPARSTS